MLLQKFQCCARFWIGYITQIGNRTLVLINDSWFDAPENREREGRWILAGNFSTDERELLVKLRSQKRGKSERERGGKALNWITTKHKPPFRLGDCTVLYDKSLWFHFHHFAKRRMGSEIPPLDFVVRSSAHCNFKWGLNCHLYLWHHTWHSANGP